MVPSTHSRFMPLLDADPRPTRDGGDHANENRRETGPHPRGVATRTQRPPQRRDRPGA